VPEYCTCGAQLPPDARFCHKCGKPQFEEASAEEQPPEPAVVPVVTGAVAQPPLINFRNPLAVRPALLAAAVGSLLLTVPLPPAFSMGWLLLSLLAAGFLAVWFYRRRTQAELSVRDGMRMGWITGMFCFVIAMLFFTVSVLLISRKGGLASFYRDQFAARGAIDANVEQFLEILQNPAGLATVLLLSLLFVFVFFTLLPTIGGAIGAKLLSRD